MVNNWGDVQQRAGLRGIAEWEAERGALTAAELDAAKSHLAGNPSPLDHDEDEDAPVYRYRVCLKGLTADGRTVRLRHDVDAENPVEAVQRAWNDIEARHLYPEDVDLFTTSFEHVLALRITTHDEA